MIHVVGDAVGKGGKATRFIVKNGDEIGGKVIVIGEGMSRVKHAAKQLQKEGKKAKWYQVWGKNFPNRPMTNLELKQAKNRNERWLKSKIDEYYEIYDIGLDPSRDINNRSPFYELEQNIIRDYNYPTKRLEINQ